MESARRAVTRRTARNLGVAMVAGVAGKSGELKRRRRAGRGR